MAAKFGCYVQIYEIFCTKTNLCGKKIELTLSYALNLTTAFLSSLLISLLFLLSLRPQKS
jgi:hypothetical protein